MSSTCAALISSSRSTRAATSKASGPTYIVRSSGTLQISGRRSIVSRRRSRSRLGAASPSRRPFVSRPSWTATTTSKQPTRIAAAASHACCPVSARSPTPTAAKSRPTRSVESSESTAFTVGSLLWRMYLRSGTSAARASVRTWRSARRNDVPSARKARTIVPIASAKLSSCVGWTSRTMPSPIEKTAPARKIITAASSVQKNRSLP